jgi:hypothetical protein
MMMIVEIEGVAEDRRPGHEAALAAGIGQFDGGQTFLPPNPFSEV